MIGRVLLELHKLDACIPVMRVVISKPDHQDVFYVIILSFNRSLTLQMTGFTMNCNPNRPEVFNFRDDVGCKRSTIFALKDCLRRGKISMSCAATSAGRLLLIGHRTQNFVRWA